MNANQNRTRPATLVENDRYVLHDKSAPESQPNTGQPVEFVCYTPCPAVVIIKDQREVTRRVLRDDLFISPEAASPPAGGSRTAALPVHRP